MLHIVMRTLELQVLSTNQSTVRRVEYSTQQNYCEKDSNTGWCQCRDELLRWRMGHENRMRVICIVKKTGLKREETALLISCKSAYSFQ